MTCECGCGGATSLLRGRPRRFIHGHNRRRILKPVRWEVEDRGYETPCWVWQLSIVSKGYGKEKNDGRAMMAHRAVYESLVGPIPDELVLDHLCRVRSCVNPEHLEPVTNAENIRRGEGPSVVNAAKTHCKHGHEFTGKNTGRDRGGYRACRACGVIKQRKYQQRKVAA
jgi:HNH endonuclease